MKTQFLGIIGASTMTMSGGSVSTANMPKYVDFYLLLDNSPSMGVGATPTDVQIMVNNTSDKCAFACHDVSNSNNYYNLAKSLGVTTRIDVLRTATQQLMDTAASTETYSNQFRMAIYDFGLSADSAALSKPSISQKRIAAVLAIAPPDMTFSTHPYCGSRSTMAYLAITSSDHMRLQLINEAVDRCARGIQHETVPIPGFKRSGPDLVPARLDKPLDIGDATFHAPAMLGEVTANDLDLHDTGRTSQSRLSPSVAT
jgi:hypothetical protein